MTNQPAIRPGQILTGALFNEPMRVETVREGGPNAWIAGLVGTQSERFRNVTLTARDLESLRIVDLNHLREWNHRAVRLSDRPARGRIVW